MDDPELFCSKSICFKALARERDMTFVTLDADKLDRQSSAPSGGAGIVEPAPPAATEFNSAEAALGHLYGTQRKCPFCDVGVPVSRDRDRLDHSFFGVENARKIAGRDFYPEKVRQIVWIRLKIRHRMTLDCGYRIERRIVMKERAVRHRHPLWPATG